VVDVGTASRFRHLICFPLATCRLRHSRGTRAIVGTVARPFRPALRSASPRSAPARARAAARCYPHPDATAWRTPVTRTLPLPSPSAPHVLRAHHEPAKSPRRDRAPCACPSPLASAPRPHAPAQARAAAPRAAPARTSAAARPRAANNAGTPPRPRAVLAATRATAPPPCARQSSASVSVTPGAAIRCYCDGGGRRGGE